MSLSKLPFPSIDLVLASNPASIPRRPSVLRLDENTFPMQSLNLMNTMDDRDNAPLERQHLSYVHRGRLPTGSPSKRGRMSRNPASHAVALLSRVIHKITSTRHGHDGVLRHRRQQ